MRFRVLWWNVENLFDTVPDLTADDRTFLPGAERQWDSRRYWAKQGALARVLLAAGGVAPLDLVGLGEVENDSVVRDLCRRTRLARLAYDYIVTQGADRRGIDLALLYQPARFALIGHRAYRVPFDTVRGRPTRDLLLVSGRIPGGDTLDVLLAHFPSRRGGAARTTAYRDRAARLAAYLADSVAHCRTRPHVLLMGDLNAEPADPCLRALTKGRLVLVSTAARPTPQEGHEDIEGTYFFRGRWQRIDHMAVAEGMLSASETSADAFAPPRAAQGTLRTSPADCRIFAPDFLLERRFPIGHRPRRLYLGPVYHGGVSDHLPIMLDLWGGGQHGQNGSMGRQRQ